MASARSTSFNASPRAGHDNELFPPDAAIDPSEDEVSINAAITLRDQFAQDRSGVQAFLDALLNLLTGTGQRQ